MMTGSDLFKKTKKNKILSTLIILIENLINFRKILLPKFKFMLISSLTLNRFNMFTNYDQIGHELGILVN